MSFSHSYYDMAARNVFQNVARRLPEGALLELAQDGEGAQQDSIMQMHVETRVKQALLRNTRPLPETNDAHGMETL